MDEIDPPIAGLPAPRDATTLVGFDGEFQRFLRSWTARTVHHGMLLTGRRGIGKATFAYHVAKFVLADAGSLEEALASDQHRQIAQGAAQRFRRLARGFSQDGKPKREIGVDEVRALGPFLRQRASAGEWKVVLIDAANDLNVASANALLKILEEPGDRTLFLIVAHGDGDLLPTIRSRCLRVRCDPLNDKQLRDVLERSDLAGDDIDRAIPFAKGSVRRAIHLIEDGGLDAIDGIERVLSKPRIAADDLGRLAGMVAGRGGEGAFGLIREELADTLRRRAVAADPTVAIRLADVSQAVPRALGEREEYGVDRGLSIRTALQRAHEAIWNR